MRRTVLAACASSVLVTLSLTALAGAAAPAGPRFGTPVLLTTDKGAGGYEPGVIVDKFNNIVVTAHKQNATLVVSPDSRSTTKVRSQSWLWTSTDGKTFTDLPGLTPAQEQNAEFGDEGDLAYDETGHIYFVDTNVTDNSFSRYKATGTGKLALETTRPVGPFGEPVDDRPWVAAHGDGVVLYAGNSGNRDYPLGAGGDGSAYGPGRYTVYMSTNHGDTFDPLGITLADSGWCRPAADHRAGSKDFYVLCTNDNGSLWAFSSHDDGASWSRSPMGTYDKKDTNDTYPSVAVDAKGNIYALYNDSRVDGNGNPKDSTLWLFTSTDRGRTWSQKNVTPKPGIIRYTWLDVARNGTLGIGYYYRADTGSDWNVYAGTALPGKPFGVTKVSTSPIASKANGSAFGDFFQVAFGPDNKLNIVWTALNKDLVLDGLNTDIYFARQQ